MNKSRHEEIISLVEQNHIEKQEELTNLLKEAGYSVTQATVSRDIKKLGLIKVRAKNGRQIYALPKGTKLDISEKYLRILRDSFISMEPAMNLLVIKTVSGMAMAAAAALDAMHWPEIVGAVAGDDTIMIAARSLEDIKSLEEKLGNIVL